MIVAGILGEVRNCALVKLLAVLIFVTGSTVVFPYNDTSLTPVELGASIFIEDNKNLWRATEEFKLERVNFEDEDESVGFWDGEEFLFVVGISPFRRREICLSFSRWTAVQAHTGGGARSKRYGATDTRLQTARRKCR